MNGIFCLIYRGYFLRCPFLIQIQLLGTDNELYTTYSCIFRNALKKDEN